MSSNHSMRITTSADKKMKLQNQMLGYAFIPNDVLFYKILPRLPINQILIFKSVCKRWSQLTNEFFFIANQTYYSMHSSLNQSMFMYQNHDDSLSVISLEEQSRFTLPPLPSQSQPLLYQGSCNGLVSVFIKGNVYWLNKILIMRFNVEEEVVGIIPLLPNSHGFVGASVGACDGELSYCNITKYLKLNVWLRRDEWVRLHAVSLITVIEDNWDVIAPHLRKLRNFLKKFFRNQMISTMSYEGGDTLMFWVESKQGRRVFGINSKTMELQELSAPSLIESNKVYSYKAILLEKQNGDENGL
ncbi:hypothetical protein Sjap_004140 [Stephania japonica]|uniref:F-box domain-containing protein n=1 Tax=Stephania japonica TaxID=461633 RepID=A0AAP0K1R2_9MAGN